MSKVVTWPYFKSTDVTASSTGGYYLFMKALYKNTATVGSWLLPLMASLVSVSRHCIMSGAQTVHPLTPRPTWMIFCDALLPSPDVASGSLYQSAWLGSGNEICSPTQRQNQASCHQSVREESAGSGTRPGCHPRTLTVRGGPPSALLSRRVPRSNPQSAVAWVFAGEEKERREIIKWYHFRPEMSAPAV